MNGDIICGECGAPMKEYDLIDQESGEADGTVTVCPKAWREEHP